MTCLAFEYRDITTLVFAAFIIIEKKTEINIFMIIVFFFVLWMKLLIFNFMYYSFSQLHRISKLCIVAVWKFVINQLLCCFFLFSSVFLVVFLILSSFFSLFSLTCSSSSCYCRRVEFRLMKNYAIPSFAYVGSAYRCVNY